MGCAASPTRSRGEVARWGRSSAWLGAQLAADGLPLERLRRLPLAMSPPMERLARGAAVRARRPGEPLRVLSASSLWEGKGVHVFLEAALRAAGAGAHLDLEIAGSGEREYVARLERIAAGLGPGRVRFLGQLEREALSDAMGRAHVLCFPSLWGEPYALAPLEAMGHGLVPVASAEGGTPEQIEHGRTGILVPAGDVGATAAALVELEADEPRRAALARAAREQAFEHHRQARFLDGFERELARVLVGADGGDTHGQDLGGEAP